VFLVYCTIILRIGLRTENGINCEVIAPAQRSFSVVRARPAELSRLHMGCARMFELVCISMFIAVTAEPNPLPPKIVSLSPRAVGLEGGANLVIKGSDFPFYNSGNAPRDFVLVGAEPCEYVKHMSPVRGNHVTCLLPPQEKPGLFEVMVAGQKCESCSVEYSEGLQVIAQATAPTTIKAFAAGDEIPLMLALPPKHYVTSVEQFYVTIGGNVVSLKGSAFGNDLGVDDDEFLVRKLQESRGKKIRSSTVLVSVPVPLDIAAGEHELSIAINGMPGGSAAHGRVKFIGSGARSHQTMPSFKLSVSYSLLYCFLCPLCRN